MGMSAEARYLRSGCPMQQSEWMTSATWLTWPWRTWHWDINTPLPTAVCGKDGQLMQRGTNTNQPAIQRGPHLEKEGHARGSGDRQREDKPKTVASEKDQENLDRSEAMGYSEEVQPHGVGPEPPGEERTQTAPLEVAACGSERTTSDSA